MLMRTVHRQVRFISAIVRSQLNHESASVGRVRISLPRGLPRSAECMERRHVRPASWAVHRMFLMAGTVCVICAAHISAHKQRRGRSCRIAKWAGAAGSPQLR